MEIYIYIFSCSHPGLAKFFHCPLCNPTEKRHTPAWDLILKFSNPIKTSLSLGAVFFPLLFPQRWVWGLKNRRKKTGTETGENNNFIRIGHWTTLFHLAWLLTPQWPLRVRLLVFSLGPSYTVLGTEVCVPFYAVTVPQPFHPTALWYRVDWRNSRSDRHVALCWLAEFTVRPSCGIEQTDGMYNLTLCGTELTDEMYNLAIIGYWADWRNVPSEPMWYWADWRNVLLTLCGTELTDGLYHLTLCGTELTDGMYHLTLRGTELTDGMYRLTLYGSELTDGMYRLTLCGALLTSGMYDLSPMWYSADWQYVLSDHHVVQCWLTECTFWPPCGTVLTDRMCYLTTIGYWADWRNVRSDRHVVLCCPDSHTGHMVLNLSTLSVYLSLLIFTLDSVSV